MAKITQTPLKVFFILGVSTRNCYTHTFRLNIQSYSLSLLCHYGSHLGSPFSFYPISIKWSGLKHFILAQLTWKPCRSPGCFNLKTTGTTIVSVITNLQDGSEWPLLILPQYSQLYIIPFHFVSGLVCITKKIWVKWQCVTFKVRSSKTLWFLPCSWITSSSRS